MKSFRLYSYKFLVPLFIKEVRNIWVVNLTKVDFFFSLSSYYPWISNTLYKLFRIWKLDINSTGCWETCTYFLFVQNILAAYGEYIAYGKLRSTIDFTTCVLLVEIWNSTKCYLNNTVYQATYNGTEKQAS